MRSEENSAGQETPRHHRPAARDADPLLPGIAHDQRSQRERERHGEAYIAQVKHGRMNHHLGILQQRVKPRAVGGKRARHQRERMSGKIQQQQKENLNCGDDGGSISKQPGVRLVSSTATPVHTPPATATRTAATLPAPTTAWRTCRARADRDYCDGRCKRWRNRPGKRRSPARRHARNTRAKVAIPARRAVSPSRSEPGPGWAKASAPARNEYALNANASRSAKLPICDMEGPD